MDKDTQRKFMYLAILEGRKALPDCLPNPPVGCVLVRRGEVVSTGYTSAPGEKHAEAVALSHLLGPLTDVTAFVTLEPCSFYGRTPSCAQELVARQVARVFISILDPDIRNNGAGVEILRQGGVEVSVGLLEELTQKELSPHLALKENGSASSS